MCPIHSIDWCSPWPLLSAVGIGMVLIQVMYKSFVIYWLVAHIMSTRSLHKYTMHACITMIPLQKYTSMIIILGVWCKDGYSALHVVCFAGRGDQEEQLTLVRTILSHRPNLELRTKVTRVTHYRHHHQWSATHWVIWWYYDGMIRVEKWYCINISRV